MAKGRVGPSQENHPALPDYSSGNFYSVGHNLVIGISVREHNLFPNAGEQANQTFNGILDICFNVDGVLVLNYFYVYFNFFGTWLRI